MKIHIQSISMGLLLLICQSKFHAQSNIDLSASQVQGYALIGLGFTTVAYTYHGQNDLNNNTNQRAFFYTLGTGLAVAGVLILVKGPKKRSSSNYWSGLSIAKPGWQDMYCRGAMPGKLRSTNQNTR